MRSTRMRVMGSRALENNLSFMAITEAFLSRTLGRRLEPIGEAFNGSSVRILNGGDEIPGLDGVVVDSE